MRIIDSVDAPDLKREVNWLVQQTVCESCGTRVEPGSLITGYRCRKAVREGYVVKHSKFWRLCSACDLGLHRFASFILPVIENMPQIPLLNQLVEIQQMPQPAGQMFYIDYVIGAKRTMTRGMRRHTLMLDEGNFRLETPPDRIHMDFTVIADGTVKLEP